MEMQSDLRSSMILGLERQVKCIASGVARRTCGAVVFGDLVNEGWLGAIKAVDNFDAENGTSLSAYAEHRIRGAILDYLRRLDFMSRSDRAAAKKEGAESSGPLSLEGLTNHGRRFRSAEADPTVQCELDSIIARADLTFQESEFVTWVLLREQKAVELAHFLGIHPSRMSQIRASSMLKMRAAA